MELKTSGRERCLTVKISIIFVAKSFFKCGIKITLKLKYLRK